MFIPIKQFQFTKASLVYQSCVFDTVQPPRKGNRNQAHVCVGQYLTTCVHRSLHIQESLQSMYPQATHLAEMAKESAEIHFHLPPEIVYPNSHPQTLAVPILPTPALIPTPSPSLTKTPVRCASQPAGQNSPYTRKSQLQREKQTLAVPRFFHAIESGTTLLPDRQWKYASSYV